jgi:hypothetical protein
MDGLGRSIQTTLHAASGTTKDVVIPNSYDIFRRAAVQYMPYVVAGVGYDYQPNPYNPSNLFNFPLYNDSYIYGYEIKK